MLNKRLILIILIFALLYLGNVSSTDLKPIRTYLNISVIGFGDGNETKFNLTIRNEDVPITIENINKNSNINQNNLIVLIREVDINQTELNNLTMECLKRVSTVDGNALIECRESKARQFDTIQIVQTENSALRGQAGNLSVCQINLAAAQGNLGNYSAANEILRIQVNSAKNNTTTWVISSILATAIIAYIIAQRKYGYVKSDSQRVQGRNTTAEPDYPERFKNAIKDITKGNPQP